MMPDKVEGMGKAGEPFVFSGFLVVRTPLLPFSEYQSLCHIGGAVTNEDTAESGESVRRHIQSVIERPSVSEALLVASRSLYERAKTWRATLDSRKSQKIQNALLKYIARMTYRCTPFGQFAGVSCAAEDILRVGAGETRITLGGQTEYKRLVRLDMGVLADISEQLQSDPNVQQELRFFINPTLCRIGDRWHYVEARRVRGLRRFEQTYVECSPYLDAVVGDLLSKGEAVAAEHIAGVVAASAPAASSSEVMEFIGELVKSRVVFTTLDPMITGGDPLEILLQEVSGAKASESVRKLGSLLALIREVQKTSVGAAREGFKQVETSAKDLLKGGAHKDVVQVDLFKPIAAAAISTKLISDLGHVAVLLSALSPKVVDSLREFCTSFRSRFGDEAVPLLEALDPNCGLPFGDPGGDDLPLLSGLPLGRPNQFAGAMHLTDSALYEVLFPLFERSCREDLAEIEIDQATANQLIGRSSAQLPSSFFVGATVVGDPSSSEDIAVVRAVGGPSAANLMGRFCSGDSGLAEEVKKLLRNEEEAVGEDSIVAEIVHWPVGRLGNVILRPSLRRHEIPIYGRSSAIDGARISLSDLLVSVVDNKIVLTSKTCGRRVIPRLTSAHNFTNRSISIYRFLATLQHQEGMILPFRWPEPIARHASRTPRVVYRNCIISPQAWRISREQLSLLRGVKGRAGCELVRSLVQEQGWPRYVELVEGDNCLPVDVTSSLSLTGLIEELKFRHDALIREAFVPGNAPCVQGPEGSFNHEILVPYLGSTFNRAKVHGTGASTQSILRRQPANASTGTCHPPGSEWLYAKIYTGPATADVVLSNLQSLIQRLVGERAVDRWFFIRYADPQRHIRLRMRGHPKKLWGDVLLELNSELSRSNLAPMIWKTELGTYEQETKRYGGHHAIDIAEGIFQVDSEWAMHTISGGLTEDPEERWKIALASASRYWNLAEPDCDKRAALYAEFAQRMRHYLGADKSTKTALDQRFRKVKPIVESVVSNGGEESSDPTGQSFLDGRDLALRPQIERLRDLSSSGFLDESFESIIASYVHMSLNRIFSSSSNEQELVVYEILARWWRGALARARQLQAGNQVCRGRDAS
ncbi:lantibiotic dehydratase [Sinimarinibacterium flocculans]|uniref:lantibiotic dehydratase n=1 Tax=Sinimarinibacterium flocculans TaxID=985250 RepID=UPI0035134726